MDLYHRDGEEKKFRISQAKRFIYSILKLIEEIAKCDVYCANCRVIIDVEKATKERSANGLKSKDRRSFLRAALRQLKNAPCSDCNSIFPSYAMELDHISDNKIDGITRMINIDAPIERIQEELDKVELVCANCHRVRTYNRRHKHEK
jgi:5-methylcytosine-specific restriction endonuclease McrA